MHGERSSGERRGLLPDFVAQKIPFVRLAERVVFVMAALPDDVLADLLDDPSFDLAMEQFTPGRGTQVFFPLGQGPWRGSRLVVLRRRLIDSPTDFAQYIIAHELAHAFLRNGGFGLIDDPEHAADTLASLWGFGRPEWFYIS